MDPDHYLSRIGDIITFLPLTSEVYMLAAAALFLLLFSAFISASEIAFVSLSSTDLKTIGENEHPRDELVRFLLKKPDHLLVTHIIVGSFINISFIILSNYLIDLSLQFEVAAIAYAVRILVLAFLLLLFGELVPKIYASGHSLNLIRRSSGVIRLFYWFLSPISRILVSVVNRFSHRLSRKGHNISMDELSQVLELTSDEIKDEKDILEGIIKFGDKMVADVMTPRVDIDFVDIRLNFRGALDRVIETGYSRIPVYSGAEDAIKGVLYSKDLLPYLNKPENFRWQSLIRPAYFVPETKKIDDLLEEFKTSKIHMAIVVDEYGGTSGLITMEDVLEEIVGEISDEYDEEERQYIRLDDGAIIFEARILLNDFYKVTGIDEDEFAEVNGEAETLAGMILEIKGEFPARREVIYHGRYAFQILEMDKRRIRKIKFWVADT